MNIDDFPNEILDRILGFTMDPEWIYAANLVCRRWHEIINLTKNKDRCKTLMVYNYIDPEELVEVTSTPGIITIGACSYAYPFLLSRRCVLSIVSDIMKRCKDKVRSKAPQYSAREREIRRAVFRPGRAGRVTRKGNVYTLRLNVTDEFVNTPDPSCTDRWFKLFKLSGQGRDSSMIHINFVDVRLRDGSYILQIMPNNC